jgi:hypothetical protein
MTERYDMLTVREKDGRAYFTKIGVMFPNRNGEGFTAYFEALPVPGPDGCKVVIKKAEERPQGNRGAASRPEQSSARPASQYDDVNEEAPF